jgi:hypothetical protein
VGSLIVSVCDCAHICLQGDLARVVQSALFVSAINTLVQTILGSRLPAAMGNSFYFLPITLSIVNAPRIVDIEDPHEVGVWPCFFFPPPFLFSFLAHIPPYLHPSFLPSIKQQRWLVPTHPCAEICARNEGNAGSFHRWFSPKHHSWLQWHMGHSCQVNEKPHLFFWCLKPPSLLLLFVPTHFLSCLCFTRRTTQCSNCSRGQTYELEIMFSSFNSSVWVKKNYALFAIPI